MKYFILQTPGEIRLVTASDTVDGKLNLQMKGFRITSGILESWEKDEKISVGFLDRLLKHGYISITESEYSAYLNIWLLWRAGGQLQVKGNLTTRYLLNGFMYRIEVGGTTNGIGYRFDPIDGVEGFEAQKIKDSFGEGEELTASPLETSVIPYDKDLKEYGFNFELTCTMLRKGQTIFKSI